MVSCERRSGALALAREREGRRGSRRGSLERVVQRREIHELRVIEADALPGCRFGDHVLHGAHVLEVELAEAA